MKKITFSLMALFVVAVFSGCDELPTFEEQLEIDKKIIEEYVAEQGLTGEYTENGVFYSIEKEGKGTEYPTTGSSIEIIYTGTFLDGEEFDSSDGFPVNFNVYNLIRGWQEGIQKFKKDSKGILVIPSGLAYGPNGTFGIPPDAVIRFDIELLDFN